MVKNLEGRVKLLMYPRFVQVFLDKQVEGMYRHKGIYVIPSHTMMVFSNMKRPGKGFSGKQKSRRTQRKDSGPTECIPDKATNEEHVATPSCDPPQSELEKKSIEFGKEKEVKNIRVQEIKEGKEVVAEKEVAEKEVSVVDPVTT
ncbi:hypothetical protein Tco_1324189, partial [Tanacetum coccineum]